MISQRPHILLVDDDCDFVEATSAVIESAYEVTAAYSGQAGLQQARQARPDLIILDVIMPGEDGFEICEQIKADPGLADLPVILLTSLPDGIRSPGGRISIHAIKYLEKPVRPAELLRQIGQLLSQTKETQK